MQSFSSENSENCHQAKMNSSKMSRPSTKSLIPEKSSQEVFGHEAATPIREPLIDENAPATIDINENEASAVRWRWINVLAFVASLINCILDRSCHSAKDHPRHKYVSEQENRRHRHDGRCSSGHQHSSVEARRKLNRTHQWPLLHKLFSHRIQHHSSAHRRSVFGNQLQIRR